MHGTFDKIRRCWERIACTIMAVLCLLCILCAVLLMLDKPSVQEIKGAKPVASRIFPWNSLSGNFFSPAIPEARDANPFRYVLVNKEKPIPKKQEPPKVQQPKVVEKPEVKVVKPTPAAPPPKVVKPDIVITITYDGFYVDTNGEPVGSILIEQDNNKKQERIWCKEGSLLLNRIRLEKMTEENAVFSTDAGKVTVQWNTKHQFRFKQE